MPSFSYSYLKEKILFSKIIFKFIFKNLYREPNPRSGFKLTRNSGSGSKFYLFRSITLVVTLAYVFPTRICPYEIPVVPLSQNRCYTFQTAGVRDRECEQCSAQARRLRLQGRTHSCNLFSLQLNKIAEYSVCRETGSLAKWELGANGVVPWVWRRYNISGRHTFICFPVLAVILKSILDHF